jgi:hypothetical protein
MLKCALACTRVKPIEELFRNTVNSLILAKLIVAVSGFC